MTVNDSMAFTQDEAIAYYNSEFIGVRSAVRVAAMLYCFANDIAIRVGDEVYRKEDLSALLVGDEQGVFLDGLSSSAFESSGPVSGRAEDFSVERYGSEDDRFDLSGIVRYVADKDGRVKAFYREYHVAEEILETRSPEELIAYFRSDPSVLGM